MVKRRSAETRKRNWRLWIGVGLAAILIAGAARLSSQEVDEVQKLPLARLQPPPLLSRGEVERSLPGRFAAMERRLEAYKLRRRAGAARDYRVPEPPSRTMVPARPDTPEGEITKQRLGASR